MLLAGAGGGAPTISAAFLQTAILGTDTTTYTFTAQNLGTAAADRTIIVVGHARVGSVPGVTVSSVTVGGVSATIDVSKVQATANSTVAFIARAAVPSGTTGDVVVTLSSGALRAAIALYRVTGGSVSVKSSDSAGVGSGSNPTLTTGTLTTAPGGILIQGVSVANSAASALSAVSWTEDYLLTVIESVFSGAAGVGAATTGADVTPSVSITGGDSECALVAVAYQGA